MNTVILHHTRLEGDVLQHKWRERDVHVGGHPPKGVKELFRILGAVVRWDEHPGQKNSGAAVPGQADEFLEVPANLFRGDSSKTIIAAEFDHDQCRLVYFQGPGQARHATAGSVSTDTGVDDPVGAPRLGDALLEQEWPRFAPGQAVTGTQAVTQDEHGRLRVGTRGTRPEQGKDGQ